ncbi:glycosyltransferase [Alkalihalobacterium alkalinitrilicum]|uniref:glycosyltransferase n=1 Tax=Alkalihalobacterium alkalinitrilicum TaxID=427920 RepID=UPI000994DD18|nr:glycosyltransferase [Alkalihalobacterium alkalinitrilicum]
MKKNLLFVMPSLSAGGGEKSLVNLLQQIDYNNYNVDLFLFSQTGLFFNTIPKEVAILDLPLRYIYFTKSFKHSIEHFIKNSQINLAYNRVMFTLKNRYSKNSDRSEQYTWKFLRSSFDQLEKEYDAAIGYLEKTSIYFVVDKVKAKKKIGWIHTNYTNSGMDRDFDQYYFNRLDHIITVSEECATALKENFVELSKKVKVIYNIVSPKVINKLSIDNVEDVGYSNGVTDIVTVARLSHEKGIDIAIQSCKILIEKGYPVRWFVIGEGKERVKLETMIKDLDLTDVFILLGTKENPYPYIKNADIYVQPSRYEGKSIAIDEAKILNKPIVVTNFKTAKDQITDGNNGIIVNQDDESIADGVEILIKDKAQRNILATNLSCEKLGTEEEIEKLYQIF